MPWLPCQKTTWKRCRPRPRYENRLPILPDSCHFDQNDWRTDSWQSYTFYDWECWNPQPHSSGAYGRRNICFPYHCQELGAGLKWSLTRASSITKKTLHAPYWWGKSCFFYPAFRQRRRQFSPRSEFIKKTPRRILSISIWAARSINCQKQKLELNGSKDPEKIYKIINKVQSILDIPPDGECSLAGLTESSLAVENVLAEAAESLPWLCTVAPVSKCILVMLTLRPYWCSPSSDQDSFHR